MRGLSSTYQTDYVVGAATAAAMAVEGDVIDVIEVDTGNQSIFLGLMLVLMLRKRKGTCDYV